VGFLIDFNDEKENHRRVNKAHADRLVEALRRETTIALEYQEYQPGRRRPVAAPETLMFTPAYTRQFEPDLKRLRLGGHDLTYSFGHYVLLTAGGVQAAGL
jgi:hypothetical protein